MYYNCKLVITISELNYIFIYKYIIINYITKHQLNKHPPKLYHCHLFNDEHNSRYLLL